ncbi:helix-turn-helix domain-containing protein [Symbiobacterium terraclitae]|uniref:helix-turn-helix domain-containing protein n=1 Tax=Symbiobacterium terraclitae TaxID=557451 RepID=UPI0035B54272
MNALGKRIKELRESRQWRQVDLGQRLGVTGSAVTQWERGQRVPDPATLQRIADLFGVSVDYLLGRTESAPTQSRLYLFGAVSDGKTAMTRSVLRELRERAGLTVAELAQRSGVPESRVTAYERGEEEYTGYDLVRLATTLNVSASYLAGKSDDPTIKTQLPPELEQLVDEIQKGGWTVEDVRTALRLLELARGRDRVKNQP